MSSLKITGGRLANTDAETTLLIRDGHIAALGEAAERESADRDFDAAGCILAPGFVDLCCNLREPGNGQKGNIASESLAAAHGGFTTLCASPDTSPVNDSGAVTNLILDVAAKRSAVRILPVGAITRGLEGDLLSDMAGLASAGCIALGNGARPVKNARVLRRCMAYAQTFGLTVMFSPENQALAADGYAHDGLVASRLGLLGIPEVAETAAAMEMLLLAEETGVRLHLSQLSCARSVEMLADARKRGIAVTADVAMHQLLFTEEALAGFDSRYHVRPPLRSEQDRQALLAGVRDGVIDAITSQHQPHDSAAKQAPMAATEPGLSTIESTLSMGLLLVERGELDRASLVRALTTGPASVIGRSAELRKGAVADLCVFDAAASWRQGDNNLCSVGRHVPLPGKDLPGVVRLTLCNGRQVWPHNNL
ncbi:dihydroorotase [Marinobacter panjinensis]|uniref:Dihydroorotase n=1 Tax=Marinobacter panjinensis TaxID=2576384 RepID=A0A4U6R8P9_9GAMM|nr:dihydroorotase [Marinobacter panjinensis]MCR8914441.1 dihydroorotase [Marinobacter panjinensis]TKV68726.1 dihydroorotase [Marinobacter panjinensis]